MTAVDRNPDPENQLTKFDAQIDQFGRLETTEAVTRVAISGRYGIDPYREYARQIDGSPLSGVTHTRGGGVTIIDSGVTPNESFFLTSNRYLDYSPGNLARSSGFIYRDAPPTQQMYWDCGVFNVSNGLYFREDKDDVYMIIENSGVQRKLRDIAEGVRIYKAPGPDLFDKGSVPVILYAYYGGNKVIFGRRKAEDVGLRGRNFEIFAVYDPNYDSSTLGPYMETPNLPSSIRLDTGGTPPDQAMQIYSGERALALYSFRQQPQRIQQQWLGPFTVSESQIDPILAVRPRETFRGIRNDTNIVLREVLFDMNEANADVSVWANIASDVDTNYNNSDYTAEESPVEISSGAITVNNPGIQVPPRTVIRAAVGQDTLPPETVESIAPLQDDLAFLLRGQGSAVENGTGFYVRLTWLIDY